MEKMKHHGERHHPFDSMDCPAPFAGGNPIPCGTSFHCKGSCGANIAQVTVQLSHGNDTSDVISEIDITKFTTFTFVSGGSWSVFLQNIPSVIASPETFFRLRVRFYETKNTSFPATIPPVTLFTARVAVTSGGSDPCS
jgi:hypothetical protein